MFMVWTCVYVTELLNTLQEIDIINVQLTLQQANYFNKFNHWKTFGNFLISSEMSLDDFCYINQSRNNKSK